MRFYLCRWVKNSYFFSLLPNFAVLHSLRFGVYRVFLFRVLPISALSKRVAWVFYFLLAFARMLFDRLLF